MKIAGGNRNRRSLIIICVALFAMASVPLVSGARSTSTSVTIVNNSSREIRNVYLSHVDVDDWGGNQLSEGTVIAAGQSATLSNLACDQQQVKVIGEDQDGCFVSTAISCGNTSTWTITNDTARDCGGN
jgi:hypothetical protein